PRHPASVRPFSPVSADPPPRGLRSFPTRRSSDLTALLGRPPEQLLGKDAAELGLAESLAGDAPRVIEVAFPGRPGGGRVARQALDRKSTRLNSSHEWSSYAVFCLKKKKDNTWERY